MLSYVWGWIHACFHACLVFMPVRVHVASACMCVGFHTCASPCACMCELLIYIYVSVSVTVHAGWEVLIIFCNVHQQNEGNPDIFPTTCISLNPGILSPRYLLIALWMNHCQRLPAVRHPLQINPKGQEEDYSEHLVLSTLGKFLGDRTLAASVVGKVRGVSTTSNDELPNDLGTAVTLRSTIDPSVKPLSFHTFAEWAPLTRVNPLRSYAKLIHRVIETNRVET